MTITKAHLGLHDAQGGVIGDFKGQRHEYFLRLENKLGKDSQHAQGPDRVGQAGGEWSKMPA